MSGVFLRTLLTGGLLLLSIGTGFLLSKTNRPLPTGLFTLHKLLAVVAIVFASFALDSLRYIDPSPSPLLLIATASLLLIVLITGALLSFDRFASPSLIASHQITTWLLLALWILLLLPLSNH